MGQATRGLYSLLGSRSRSLKLRELAGGKVTAKAPPASFSTFAHHGAYLVLEAPSVPEVWGALYSAITQRHPLVILPKCTPLEREVLLKQLPELPPAQAVLALFTSGTTGEPKAVFHSEASLLASAEQLAKALPGTAPTCSLLLPWSMAGVVFHCLLPAARGSDVLYSRAPFGEWAGEAAAVFVSEGIDFVTLNPFLLEMWMRIGGGTGDWRGKAISLTAPLKAAQRELFAKEAKASLHEIYGMTEAAGPVLLDGRSLGAELRLSPEGELEISGPQLFLGYGAQGQFLNQGPWFPTGDLFEKTQNHTFVHLSRTRDLIDLGGRKVAPRLVEAAFEGMPELAECLAFGKEIAGIERVGLVYVRAAGCALSEEELARKVEACAKELLSAELRPHWLREMKQVPRLAGGKPDRRKLSEL